jgi:cyanophycinase
VVDGRTVTYTNISEASADNTMSMHGVSLHILATGEVFNLSERIPYRLADVRV